MLSLLVLDDDHVFRKNLSKALMSRGFQVFQAESGGDAIRMVSERSFDAALIDMKMPEMNGFQVLQALKDIQPSIIGIILTGYGSIPDAVKTMKLGGHHYLTKPCEMDEIEELLKKVLEEKPIEEPGFRAEAYQGIVGASPGIKNVIELIKKVKDSNLPVLICGESGTGKELVARALHFDSGIKSGPFIAVNCATLKPELLENELFGHIKGAFTGAANFKEGLVKAADNGTLFIDEIADMNLTVQASLLRFIETGIFRPLGSNSELRVKTRIIAAINKDIEEEVRQKRFRHDFYYRLNVCRINIPPLRERVQDIPLLARHFISVISCATGNRLILSACAIDLLTAHSWPGNVRELFHVLQRAQVLLGPDNETITRRIMEQALHSHSGFSIHMAAGSISSLEETEKKCIIANLNTHGWNISRTASALSIDRRTLQRKIARYQISR